MIRMTLGQIVYNRRTEDTLLFIETLPRDFKKVQSRVLRHFKAKCFSQSVFLTLGRLAKLTTQNSRFFSSFLNQSLIAMQTLLCVSLNLKLLLQSSIPKFQLSHFDCQKQPHNF